jgi:diguanylate cyclase (GGDEF)-like protein/PAS domain S-box-containing protein
VGFLYDETGLKPLPAWLTRTAVLAALTILVLSVLVWRNMRLSHQLRCEIAAQEQAHRQLADIEQHTRFKLENSADIFWEMDTQFRFTYISAADYRTRGFQAAEVIGQSLLSMLTPASLRQVREEIAQLQQAEQQGQPSGPLRFEFEIYCKDGSTVWAESNSMPLRDANGHIVGYHGVTRDITAQKRHRTELIQVNTQLGQQLQEIQVLQTRLQDQAIRDALTGLFNRRYLDEALAMALDHAQRDGEPLALIMVDIDLFKHINDTHGHPAGDEVIRALGNLLRQSAREGDMACRYGGEEFIMALPRMNLESARARAEQWRQAVETLSVLYGDTHIRFTISAGVAAYPAHANEHGRLMACADLALYASKNAGRNRVTCFDATAMAA